MNAEKALNLLDSNKIEELRQLLQDELYSDALKASNPSAKKRYAAMKKYFDYHKSERACLKKPARIVFEGKNYISFTNSWSLVLTTEECGEIELFTEQDGTYPDVTRLLRFDGRKCKIDFNKVFAEARAKGYKLTKSEVGSNFKYLMLYNGAFYKIGLLEASMRIIDDGEIAMTYHPDGERMPLSIQTSLGFCMVMPVKFNIGEPEEQDKIVIYVEPNKDDKREADLV